MKKIIVACFLFLVFKNVFCQEEFSIMSPLGSSAVEMIKQKKRLDTLNGKRIAIVGKSFNAKITHEVIKEKILLDYPSVIIFTDDDVGNGGAFSFVNQSKKSKNFQKALRDNKIDAVISGNCGCGLCTVKETGSSIAAEYIGIPTVTVGSSSFIKEIKSTGINRGVPVLRTAQYFGTLSSDDLETLKKNASEILYPQIVRALTTQITKDEIAESQSAKNLSYDDVILTDTYENIQSFYFENGLSDGLPCGIATKEKVEEYLKYTPYSASDVLGIFPPAYREVKVFTVAVNAIMANCPSEFMPLCIAIVKAMNDEKWRRPLSSTHGWSPYAWLNGPILRQLGFDSNSDFENSEKCRSLGRFIELAMCNLCGYYIKENRMGTFGYIEPFVFAEDEKTCKKIGFLPYNEQIKMKKNSNTITLASFLYWGDDLDISTHDANEIKNLLALNITEKQQNGLGNTNPQVCRTLLLTSDVAKDISKVYKSKSDFEDALIESARRPLWLRTYAHYWANTGSYQYTMRPIEEHYKMLFADKSEKTELTDTPLWYENLLGKEKIATIATMQKGQSAILVCESQNARKIQTLPGGDCVTIEIELPKNWDSLMKKKGYKPLKKFLL